MTYKRDKLSAIDGNFGYHLNLRHLGNNIVQVSLKIF